MRSEWKYTQKRFIDDFLLVVIFDGFSAKSRYVLHWLLVQHDWCTIYDTIRYDTVYLRRFDFKLSFSEHISEKINKDYSILGIIKRNLNYNIYNI